MSASFLSPMLVARREWRFLAEKNRREQKNSKTRGLTSYSRILIVNFSEAERRTKPNRIRSDRIESNPMEIRPLSLWYSSSIRRSRDFSRVPTGSADYTPGLPAGSSPGLYHPTVVRGVWGRLGVVYDRVYTPPPKYCRRAPPLDFLAKILFDVKQAA